MISWVLASRLIFGSNPPGLQNLQDADQANQLFYDAETVNLNWIHNSSSNLLISNDHDQQFHQKPTFLTSEDVEDFLNFISENTINTLTEDRPPAQENEETEFDFNTYTNNNNDISTLQNNNQFDSFLKFDLHQHPAPVTSQYQDNASISTSYTDIEDNLSTIQSSSATSAVVHEAPVQVTFDPSDNTLDIVTEIAVVRSNSSRCKKYREDKKNKKMATEEELKELTLKNYTLKAKLKEKEAKVRKMRELVKSIFGPTSCQKQKLSLNAILLEFM